MARSGPWPFVTRWVLRRPDGGHAEVHSRSQRKGLPTPPVSRLEAEAVDWLHSVWQPRELNWWIGSLFAVGAVFFHLGCVAYLWPQPGEPWGLAPRSTNPLFFVGSLPFTLAAYLQLYQAANAHAVEGSHSLCTQRVWFGFRPAEIGWLSSAVQFVGTLLFNLNALDSMWVGVDWLQQDLAVWLPDALGCVLFLVSGYLAYAEAGHAYVSWQPGNLAWWITLVNLVGCVAFMLSALLAFVRPHGASAWAEHGSVVAILVGAVAFMVGALWMLAEAGPRRPRPAAGCPTVPFQGKNTQNPVA